MEIKYINTLEYPKIVEMLASKAQSPLGKVLCQAIKPITDLEQIQLFQQETKDAVSILIKKGGPGLSGIQDLRQILQHCGSGATLNPGQLLKVAQVLRVVEHLSAFCSDDEPDNILYLKMRALQPLRKLQKDISKAIVSETEIADEASSRLFSIRVKIKQIQNQIRKTLDRLLKTHEKALQETIITQRFGRYVLPVKDTHRTEIQGVVHDTSSSGQTLFIEPLVIFEYNNTIRELQVQEREEIEHILANLSQEVADVSDVCLENQKILTSIDFIFAKGELALMQKAYCPNIQDGRTIHLIHARHPLIDPEKIVPITLTLSEELPVLLITGPNTGGKTVALKTCGLLVLMAQSGLHIPASEQSIISIVDNVLVDIGDQQSIEQALSTFSSHLLNIIDITKQVGSRSLVLVDELGSGTDPIEGAALAQALINRWRSTGCFIIATTHYKELKDFALVTAGIENASCAFDPETLKPTYQLIIGSVGGSHAFKISKDLGLPEEILTEAESYLSEEVIEHNRLLATLNTMKQDLETALNTAQEKEREWEKRRAEVETLQDTLQTKKQSIIQKAREDARAQYSRSLEELDQFLKDAREILSQAEYQKLIEKRQGFKTKLNAIENEIGQETLQQDYVGEKVADFAIGELYYAPNLKANVKLLELPDSKGQCFIECNGLKLKLDSKLLRTAQKEKEKKKLTLKDKSERYKNSAGSVSTPKAMPIELKLLGYTQLDALEYLDKFIDDAQMTGLKNVRIVHGKGTGALRSAVQQFLKRDKRVKSFQLAEYGQGDSGVTIAELK